MLGLVDKIPNVDAIAVSPSIGWLLLGCAMCVFLLFALQADRWRRWWMSSEDPRSIAVFRIVFGFFVICNINGMWEFFEFLYTDEGIFTTDVARQVFAAKQFAGFGDGFGGDKWGFFDFAAVLEFLKGPKYSLLMIWDSPTFFWAHLVAFEVAAMLFVIGYRTRLMGVLTWFLMNGILFRNQLAWEGTELVYRCFLAYLLLARSGHAYSVDNWLRCRRLRKEGRLSERGGPGGGAGVAPSEEHPKGLEAVYRLIPSWPRKIIMLQLAALYITTGTLKTGAVWLNGDSLYYALNMDHFYRLPPQFLSSLVGTSVFRGMTWAVKVGQTSFALVIFSIVARWGMRQNFPELRGLAKWGVRAAFAGLILLTAGIVYVAWPVHFTPPIRAELFVAIWIAVWGGLWWGWRSLAARPRIIKTFRGRTLAEPIVIDRDFVCRWFIGRRILLLWHLAFHVHIFMLISVGQFQTGMLSVTFAFLTGSEIAAMLRAIGYRLGQWNVPFIPASVTRGEPPLPAEDPTLPHHHHDSALLPNWTLFTFAGFVLVGVLVRVRLNPEWGWYWIWVAGFGFLALMTLRVVRESRAPLSAIDACTGRARMPWSYGPFGRLFVGSLIVWQITAVAVWLLPAKDCVSTFRAPARKVFAKWLTLTTTDQGWGMFAPNPPRHNVFLKVMVTDKDGESWDLRTDVYAEEHKPIPWIWNTRRRKMNRRIIGGESGPSQWYRKWYARYVCRQWARAHNGEAPRKVDLVKVSYRIPSPAETRRKGYYIAEQLLQLAGRERIAHTENCSHTVMGQLPNFIRERDGLPLLEEGEYRPWIKKKTQKWERREQREAEREARKAKVKAKKKAQEDAKKKRASQ